MKILVIDVGGSHVKMLATGRQEPARFPSGPDLTASRMVRGVLKATRDWRYDAVTIGYPGPVVHGKILEEPVNLGRGWKRFDFVKAFGRPVAIVNDAAMQALGSYEGGRMLFLGLGTGMGNTLIDDGHLHPMELGHLPYKKGKTFEDYVGEKGLKRLGRRHWEAAVHDVVGLLSKALLVEYVMLGGGNVRLLRKLPRNARKGRNTNAFLGGFMMWEGRKMRD
jgi:polyphosphate glucokinase